MSQTVKRATGCRDPQILEVTCRETEAEWLGQGRHELYERKVNGLGVRFPGWQFPVVFDGQTGEAAYDDYNGRWGNTRDLDQFCQEYARQATKHVYAGMDIREERLTDGSIKMTISVKPSSPTISTRIGT